jgi:hypothetical protein
MYHEMDLAFDDMYGKVPGLNRGHFCNIKSLEHLKNLKNGPLVLYLGLKLTVHVFKSKIHLVRQSL